MVFIGPDVPIPQQIEKFWSSPNNKTNLQCLTRELATEQYVLEQVPIVLSGCVVDDEVVPAELVCPERSSADPSTSASIDTQTLATIDALTCTVEEADYKILLRCAWEVGRGCVRLLVISNDTDTLVRLLYFCDQWKEQGLRELWIIQSLDQENGEGKYHCTYWLRSWAQGYVEF